MHMIVFQRYSRRVFRFTLRTFTSTALSYSNKKPCDDIKIPPEPTTCCMSGCANCVWIAYAEELSKLYEGNSEKARQIILDKIDDPNLKMFLSIELKYIHRKSEEK